MRGSHAWQQRNAEGGRAVLLERRPAAGLSDWRLSQLSGWRTGLTVVGGWVCGQGRPAGPPSQSRRMDRGAEESCLARPSTEPGFCLWYHIKWSVFCPICSSLSCLLSAARWCVLLYNNFLLGGEGGGTGTITAWNWTCVAVCLAETISSKVERILK